MSSRAGTGADAPDVVAPMTFLDRAAILAAEDIVYRTVEVPEWGGMVRLRSLSGTERDAYDAESYALGRKAAVAGQAGGDIVDFRVRRVARSICDGNGKPLFTTADVAAFGKKNGAVIDRLDDIVAEISGFATSSAATTGRAAEALKADPNGGSGSD